MLVQRQFHNEDTALAYTRPAPDTPVMALDNIFADGKPETQTALR